MSALVWHPVRGRSMWPLGTPLQVGVRQVPPERVMPGDVVAFIAGHRQGPMAPSLWIHRVARIEATCVITRGDTNGFDDRPVPDSAVLGRVEALRLGPLRMAVAHAGVWGQLRRELGRAWSQVAPALLRAHRRRKSGETTGDDP